MTCAHSTTIKRRLDRREVKVAFCLWKKFQKQKKDQQHATKLARSPE